MRKVKSQYAIKGLAKGTKEAGRGRGRPAVRHQGRHRRRKAEDFLSSEGGAAPRESRRLTSSAQLSRNLLDITVT